MMIRKLIQAGTAALMIGFSSFGMAGHDTQTDANGVTLAGHDAVAYFTQGRAVVGDPRYTAVHNEAIYRFSSTKNRDLFRADAEKYAPAYGGFCAFGATFGKKFEVDGKAFEIVEGKLYVNKNLKVYEAWQADIPKHIAEADDFWPEIELTPPAAL